MRRENKEWNDFTIAPAGKCGRPHSPMQSAKCAVRIILQISSAVPLN